MQTYNNNTAKNEQRVNAKSHKNLRLEENHVGQSERLHFSSSGKLQENPIERCCFYKLFRNVSVHHWFLTYKFYNLDNLIFKLKWGRGDSNRRHLHWKYQEVLLKLHRPWLQIIQFWFDSKHIDQGQWYDSE